MPLGEYKNTPGIWDWQYPTGKWVWNDVAPKYNAMQELIVLRSTLDKSNSFIKGRKDFMLDPTSLVSKPFTVNGVTTTKLGKKIQNITNPPTKKMPEVTTPEQKILLNILLQEQKGPFEMYYEPECASQEIGWAVCEQNKRWREDPRGYRKCHEDANPSQKWISKVPKNPITSWAKSYYLKHPNIEGMEANDGLYVGTTPFQLKASEKLWEDPQKRAKWRAPG